MSTTERTDRLRELRESCDRRELSPLNPYSCGPMRLELGSADRYLLASVLRDAVRERYASSGMGRMLDLLDKLEDVRA